jgi:hypothetical protein
MLQFEKHTLLFFQNLIFYPILIEQRYWNLKKCIHFCLLHYTYVRICDSNRITGGCWGASNFRTFRPVRYVVTRAYTHILAYRVYPWHSLCVTQKKYRSWPQIKYCFFVNALKYSIAHHNSFYFEQSYFIVSSKKYPRTLHGSVKIPSLSKELYRY